MMTVRKSISIVGIVLGFFTLGIYSHLQFIEHDPIALYRWIVTSLCSIVFLIYAIKGK